MEIPTLESWQPLVTGERSISAWKTEEVDQTHVKINDGSDGNEDVLGKSVEIIRYEFGGEKIIFKG